MAAAAHVTMGPAMRSPLARLLALPPALLDGLLGAFVFVEGLAEVLLLADPDGPDEFALGFAVAAIAGVAVALRRTLPITAVLLSLCSLIAADQVGRDLFENLAGPHFANMFVTLTAGYVLEARRLWAVAALGTLFATVWAGIDGESQGLGDFLANIGLGLVGPLLLGRLLRNRTRLNEALREKALRLERERARAAEAAALEERTRIAGELHDVVAHALSAMTIQAAAARRLTERDPARAREAFAGAEATGREALTELRRLLGVLRKEDEDLALAPQPSLAHIADLVRRTGAGGLPTVLHTDGERRALPAGVDLTAYRLVQEALSAAREHGGAGRADVAIRYGEQDVLVEVSDDGPGQERRLLGMSERVAVYGGELTAAGSASGGWRVAARLPLGTAA
jgi:signal transduction histidine kinase